MIKINKNSDFYIKFKNKKELEMFCKYLNTNYPRKFRWARDTFLPSQITVDYILGEGEYLLKDTLHINTNYIFTFCKSDYVFSPLYSIYDIDGIANNLPQSLNLLTWISK